MLPDTIGFDFVGFGVVSFVGLCVDIVIAHAFAPSLQVCSNLGSLLRPHFWNHDPPLPQQLGEPLILPHLGHPGKEQDMFSQLHLGCYQPRTWSKHGDLGIFTRLITAAFPALVLTLELLHVVALCQTFVVVSNTIIAAHRI